MIQSALLCVVLNSTKDKASKRLRTGANSKVVKRFECARSFARRLNPLRYGWIHSTKLLKSEIGLPVHAIYMYPDFLSYTIRLLAWGILLSNRVFYQRALCILYMYVEETIVFCTVLFLLIHSGFGLTYQIM